MRLIDADALMHEIEKIRWHLQMLDDTQSSDKVWSGVRMAEKKVEDAPTIDAVPVVRCKDCWFGDKCEDRSDLYDCCVGDYNAEHRNAAYGFCYKGKERRNHEID